MQAYHRNTRRFLTALPFFLAAALLGACDQHPVATRSDAPPPTSGQLLKVSVSPASPRLHVGDTITLRAEVRDAFGHTIPDLIATWGANAAAVVIVSPDGASARVTAIGAGEARVSARVQDIAGAASVSVAPADAPPDQ